MKTIDDAILHQCTRFSHWLQRTVGLTNFFVAKVGLFSTCLSLFIIVVSHWIPIIETKISITTIVFGIICLAYQVYRLHLCNKNEERLYRGDLLIKEFNRDNLPLYRCLWICWASLDLFILIISKGRLKIAISNALFSSGLVITEYFIAVTPLPPGMSRLTKFVKNFVNAFKRPVEA